MISQARFHRLRFGLAIAILLLSCATMYAQPMRVQGTVREAGTGEPVISAQVRAQGRLQGTLTDAQGKFTLELDAPAQVLEVSHIGFKKVYVPLAGKSGRSLDISLEPAASLAPIVISAGPQEVLEDRTIHLYDYELLDDHIMMIIYDRKLKRSKLALVDANDSIVDTELLPEEPGKLVKDCLGNIHAITQHFACQVFWDGEEIGFYQDSLALYEEAVAPCLGNLGGFYYFDRWTFNGQILDYYAYDMAQKEWKNLMHVEDKVRMHQLMDPLGPYVSIAPSRAAMYSLTPDDWEEIGKIDHAFQFDQLAFFRPIDAPLRIVDGKVVVFDHLNGQILFFERDGTKVSEVAMDYHKMPGRERMIIIDEIRGEAYTVFEKHGYQTLRRIDLATGTLGLPIEIPRQFPHKIQIRNGVAHFLYKQGSYDDTKRLYRLSL
jgi:hypothetical protein